MSKIISRSEYNQAFGAKKTISSAIDAVTEAAKLITNKEVLKHLKFAVAGLENELFSHAKVVESVDLLVKDFDTGLINHAMDRIRILNDLIRINAGFIANKQRNYENRIQEAIALRVHEKSHKPLDVAPTDEDRIRVNEERIALESELATINQFLKDGPLFDMTLLAETGIAVFIH